MPAADHGAPRGRRRRRATLLYGLPLPSPAFGVGSVMAVAGTGRLRAMRAAFLDRGTGERYDAEALAGDGAASLSQVDLVPGAP